MKLSDLFTMIEKENEFNAFMNNIERKVIKLDEYESRTMSFNNIEEFIKYFKETFYGEINSDTELYNYDGYIKFDVKYNSKEWNGKEIVLVEATATYRVYIDEEQEWN